MESELIAKIDSFTKEHKRMPKLICGSFADLGHVATYGNVFTTSDGEDVYRTVCGDLRFQLDTEATEIILK